jgi:hypothetical protein
VDTEASVEVPWAIWPQKGEHNTPTELLYLMYEYIVAGWIVGLRNEINISLINHHVQSPQSPTLKTRTQSDVPCCFALLPNKGVQPAH